MSGTLYCRAEVPDAVSMSLKRYKSRQNLSTFFHQLFNRADDSFEGIYWLSIWPADGAGLLDESFKDLLQKLITPKIHGTATVGGIWQLQNTSPGARGGNLHNGFKAVNGGPCALIAVTQDVWNAEATHLFDQIVSASVSSLSGRVPKSGSFGCELRTYELIQRFEGKLPNKSKGRCVIAVLIDPAEGQDDDIESWYRKEHLSMLAATPMFIRSTRYRLGPGLVQGSNQDAPRLLALHECTSTQAILDFAIQHGQIVPETAWSKRIFDAARSVERTIWEITSKCAADSGKLDKL